MFAKGARVIGKLERVPLREVWRQEPELTRWLQENIEVLNDILNLSLSSAEREQRAGAFSVDLIAEDDAGSPIVIENQLEKTNHDHLGKLITYMTAIESKVAIWIASDPRPEHIRAVSWLNESSSGFFYLLKVEAVRIGGSPAAPLFTVIVEPSIEAQSVGETKRELAERHILRRRFWEGLLDRARNKTRLHTGLTPGISNRMATGTGRRGPSLAYKVREHSASVELTIDRGDEEENRRVFDRLRASQETIEKAFGAPLEWYQSEGVRVCRIRSTVDAGGWRDETKWPQAQDTLIETMIRLDKALAPHLKVLDG